MSFATNLIAALTSADLLYQKLAWSGRVESQYFDAMFTRNSHVARRGIAPTIVRSRTLEGKLGDKGEDDGFDFSEPGSRSSSPSLSLRALRLSTLSLDDSVHPAEPTSEKRWRGTSKTAAGGPQGDHLDAVGSLLLRVSRLLDASNWLNFDLNSDFL